MITLHEILLVALVAAAIFIICLVGTIRSIARYLKLRQMSSPARRFEVEPPQTPPANQDTHSP